MAPMNPDGTFAQEVGRSWLERLIIEVGALTSNPYKAVTAALATLLMAFAVGVALWQISSGWLVASPVVPITFAVGLVAVKLVTEAPWS